MKMTENDKKFLSKTIYSVVRLTINRRECLIYLIKIIKPFICLLMFDHRTSLVQMTHRFSLRKQQRRMPTGKRQQAERRPARVKLSSTSPPQ